MELDQLYSLFSVKHDNISAYIGIIHLTQVQHKPQVKNTQEHVERS